MGKEQRRRCYRRSAETELRVMPGVDGHMRWCLALQDRGGGLAA